MLTQTHTITLTVTLTLALTHRLHTYHHIHTCTHSLTIILTHTHIHLHTHTHTHTHSYPDFERQFPPSELGGVRSQRSSHSSLLNGVLPPLDSPLHEEGREMAEDPILPPPAAFQGSTFIGEVDPPSSVHHHHHRERGSERRVEVCVLVSCLETFHSLLLLLSLTLSLSLSLSLSFSIS